MQTAKCIECKETVGGRDHHLVSTSSEADELNREFYNHRAAQNPFHVRYWMNEDIRVTFTFDDMMHIAMIYLFIYSPKYTTTILPIFICTYWAMSTWLTTIFYAYHLWINYDRQNWHFVFGKIYFLGNFINIFSVSNYRHFFRASKSDIY